MRIIIGIFVLMGVSASAFAQDPAKVALRLESKPDGLTVRVSVLLENLTDRPVTLRDSTSAAFSAWPWLSAKVDGKDADLQARAAYALFFSKKPAEKTIAARENIKLGEVIVLPRSVHSGGDALAPLLVVEPGEHEIELRLKEGRSTRNQLGAVTPARIKVSVQTPDAKPVTHTYKTVGDLPIKADVYRLPGNDVRPALIWIHGGALITGQRTSIRSEQRQRYLDAGYVVVAIDYRLAPETKLPGIISDVQDAFRWVREKGPTLFKVDPRKIAVVGHSAGGYLTLMSGFAVEPRPQALVAFYGYGDIDGDWYTKPDPFYRKTRPLVSKEDAFKAVGAKEIAEGNVKGRGDFYMYCRQNGLWPKLVTGHDPAKEPRAFDRFCPVRNVTKDYPPTLLLHGDNDTDVPYQQSVDMTRVLKKHGVVHELITIKNGPHGFDGKGLKDAEVAAAFGRVMAFLKKNVGP